MLNREAADVDQVVELDDDVAGEALEGPALAGLDRRGDDGPGCIRGIPQGDSEDGDLCALRLVVLSASANGNRRFE